MKKIKFLWDKIPSLGKNLTAIVLVITSVSYLYPKVESLVTKTSEYKTSLSQINQMRKDVENARNYIKVVQGILMSNMERVEPDKNFGVYLTVDDKIGWVPVFLYKANSGDIWAFVEDGKTGMYIASYNFYKRKYTYTEFKGSYRVTKYIEYKNVIIDQ